MNRTERLAIQAILDAEEVKENARRRGRAAYRDYRDACNRQNDVCDIMGIRRMNDSFETLQPVYRDRLDESYARRTGERYDDGINEPSTFSRVVNALCDLAGASRKYANDRNRW